MIFLMPFVQVVTYRLGAIPMFDLEAVRALTEV